MNPLRRGVLEVGAVARAETSTHGHLRSRLAFLAIATLAIAAVGTVLAYLFERHEAGTGIASLGDAAFWTATQLLTISSALPNPLTPAGKVLDLVLQLWAITVVTALAGSFASFFHRRGHERDREQAGG